MGQNLLAGRRLKAYLDAVPESAAPPAIEKYTGGREHRPHRVMGSRVDPPRPRGRDPRSPLSTTVDAVSRATSLLEARSQLHGADPVMARLIDARPDFDPRACLAQLPPLDLHAALL